MPEIKWTEDQKKAIEGRNGTMLVSAAAGSGKTAVLVERVIRKLSDTEHPCGIENLLIVTFTRAAAAQMKEKISKALSEKIKENPDDKNLRRNLFMLPYANICTIDSFCISLVRENFCHLDISPDFGIADAAAEAVLKERAMNEVVGRFHDERETEFRALNALVNDNKSDRRVREIISSLYELSRAYVFPEVWLADLFEKYADCTPLPETETGKAFIDKAVTYFENCLEKGNSLVPLLRDEVMRSSPEKAMAEKYISLFGEDNAVISGLLSALKDGDWNEINRKFMSMSFGKNTSHKVTDLKKACSEARSYAAKGVLIDKFPVFTFTEEDYLESVRETAPSVKVLIDVVLDYDRTLMRLKNEENIYSFNDVLHFTLDLLTENVDGKPVRSAFAKEMSAAYDEILVDEYQDVSEAQDMIFRALSKDDTNRFMVGDVKQSIYGFRQAMPEVFTSLRKSMVPFNGKDYPACVILSSNYRSRRGVTETANFIFSQIMTEYAGGVDYNEDEFLRAEAEYPEKEKGESDFEVYLLETEDGLRKQAEFTANYIKNAVENKMQVGRKGSERDAEYGDFCILMRGIGGKSRTFAEVFDKMGIPLFAETENPLLDTPEVAFILSLLKIIDNPINDIPMTAVLLSPVYGFTPDELAAMRVGSKSGSIYDCLVKASETDEKAKDFLENLGKLRRIAVTCPAGEFTAKIIDETGWRAVCSAMGNGEGRNANINMFINVAASYEKTGVKGISGFLRFLDKLEKGSGLSAPGGKTVASGSVRLMTIHKSKGLEFPVVFLVNCEKKHNDRDLYENFVVSRESGIGLNWIKNNTRYETVSHLMAVEDNKIRSHSEELRVLYVALTRAAEKTVILASDKEWEKKLAKMGSAVAGGTVPGPTEIAEMTSYLDYIITPLMLHPDAHALRQAAGLDAGIHLPCDTSAYFEIVRNTEDKEEAELPEDEPEEEPEADDALLEEIKERLTYVYPYEKLNGVVGKRIASDLEKGGFDETWFASAKPGFTSETGLTPAQRGTATHRFMQFADYEKAARNPAEEKERLVREGMLTEQESEAVDSGAISRFFESPLAARILAADEDKVYKEYAFTASLPIKDIYPEVPDEIAGDEVIIIEGVADLAFEEDGKLVIVDYKTDRASSPEELIEKYTPQLETYRKCLASAMNKEVKETVIYSFRLGREIKI